MRGSLVVCAAVFVSIWTGCVFPADGARILAVETVAGKSHWNFLSSVLDELIANGHSVTVLTPFPEADRENYTVVDISGVLTPVVASGFANLRATMSSPMTLLGFAMGMTRMLCDGLQTNGPMNEIVSRGLRGRFDALLIEPGLVDCLTHLAADAGIPVIFAVPTSSLFLKEWLALGQVSNPAVVSPTLGDHAVTKTFAQRFDNTVSLLYGTLLLAVWKTFYRWSDPKPYDSYASVAPSLVFINSHFASQVSIPVPSNVVWIGGIHLKPTKNLPKDILEFIENSPHGVILFTFGSTVAMTSLSDDVKKAFLDALAQLPQRVLLKYEGELKNKPKNVMTKNWFPQRDVLKHPNVRLFISHGGISGVYEAVDAGVPVLGFPLFADQPRNIDHLVESEMAIAMDIFSVTTNTFLANVLELLNNKKYMKNAKKVSAIFHDRPVSPQKSVVYWTEYVIRHKGAPHLKSPGLKLTWYQYILLDVLCVILLLICVSLLIIYNLVKLFKKLIIKIISTTSKTKSE